MWQNLPFFLLWVSGCLQRLCPPWDSRISRGQSQLGAGSDAQVQKRNLSFHSGSLGVKGAQSWPSSPKMQLGNAARCAGAPGGCREMFSLFGALIYHPLLWTLLPTDQGHSDHSPQTTNCIKCSFNPQWVKDLGMLALHLSSKVNFSGFGLCFWCPRAKRAAKKSLIWCYFKSYF